MGLSLGLGDPLGIYENSRIIDVKKIDDTHFYLTIIMKGNENMDKVFNKAKSAFRNKTEKELIYKMEITPAKKYICKSIIDHTGRMRREGFILSQETQNEIDQFVKDKGQESL